MDVIAEGIETDVQMMRLRAAGCDRAQGYLFARPLAPADLGPLLASGSIVLPGDAARVA
jgi:EAL domain-containing protein (putative c-di-GMP-specific phosphodiesterase class I)